MVRLTNLFTILLAFAVSACGKSKRSAMPGENPSNAPTIGIVTSLGNDNRWSKTFEEQARAEASKLGYHLVYLNSDGDSTKQGRQLRDLAAEKIVAIAFQSYQPEQLVSDLKVASEAEIPLFAIGKPSVKISGLTASIGTSQTKLGAIAASTLAEALGEEGGQVLIIDCREVSHFNQRVEGFKLAIAPHRSIEIVSELPGDANHDGGFAATADALESHPGLAGIFAVNEGCALGAVDTLKRHPQDTPVKIFAIDDTLNGTRAAHNGELTAVIHQDPSSLAVALIKAIDTSLKGKKLDAHSEVAAKKNP